MTERDPFAWLQHMACKGKPTDWWFNPDRQMTAMTICRRCPVREECLEYALHDRGAIVGIFGGKTHKERNAIKRRRGIPVRHRYDQAVRNIRTTPKPEPAA